MNFPFLQESADGVLVSLQVQPRSSRNQIVGLHGGLLRVKLTSPPVEGAANKTCCEYFAKLLHLGKSQVELVSGEKSRQKKLLIHQVTLPQVVSLLKEYL